MSTIIRDPPHPLWLWPNTLSIDAAVIAVGWQMLLSRSLDAPTGGHHAGVLCLAVWLGYVGDRWLDGRRFRNMAIQTPRHRFCRHHEKTLLVVWAVVFVAGVAYAWVALTLREFLSGCVLLALCLAHTAAVQVGSPRFRRRFPKEASVAALFCAGVVLFIRPAAVVIPLLYIVSVGCLFALCLSNCLLLASWERDADRAHGEVSAAISYPRLARNAAWLALAAPVPVAAYAFLVGSKAVSVSIALTVSGIALFSLDRFARSLPADARRATADAVLLSPYIFVSFV